MPTYLFQTILNGVSGLAEDKYVNNWHFHRNDGAPPTDYDNVRDMLKDFYETAPVGSPLRTAYTTTTLTTTVNVVGYNIDEPKPRAPVYTSSWTANWGTGDPYPHEVALCFSFEGRKESGEIQARRRNRVYLGPFKYSASHTGGRPSTTFCQDVLNAGMRLRSAADASSTWDWRIYSPTDNEIHEPVHLWVDNAWDTQRRRGLGPTARTQHTYSP